MDKMNFGKNTNTQKKKIKLAINSGTSFKVNGIKLANITVTNRKIPALALLIVSPNFTFIDT